jgi:uncharacterized protein YjbI with pentapeptide repeats
LTGAKFDGATFQGILGLPTSVPDFTLANLTNASFTNAKFEAPTYLTFANLACADFSGTDITNGNAVFGDEPLRYNSPASCRTKFQGTTMNCDFIDDWKGFDLTRANVNACITRLAGRDFSGAVLSGVNLGGAVLDGALFGGADLTLAVLDYASLQCRNQQAFPPTECVDLSHALLQGAQLNQANLSGATLYKAFLSNKPAPNPIPQAAKLKHAHLLNVNLAGAQLSGADFSWANFYGDNTGPCGTTGGKDLSGFTKGCSTAAGAVLTGTHFANAYLFGLDFGSAQIAGVDFDSAVLVGANFSGATIGIDSNTGFGTKFTRAFLQGTNLDLATTLSGADLSNAFVTFRVSDNNSIDIGLDGANHNQFACSTPSTCGPAPGQGVCVNVFFPPTTVPGNNPSITCPDGFPAGSSGCGDASSGGNLVNLRWNSHLSIDAASPPGWYKRDATYTPKAPDSAVCNKKGPSAEVTDW